MLHEEPTPLGVVSITAGDVWGVFLFVVVLVAFNFMAILLIMGRNPVLGAGFDFLRGKWGATRHKDNLVSKLFGYLWASLVFVIDIAVVVTIVKMIF